MKRLFLFVFLTLLSACSAYTERPADFVAYNTTSDKQAVAINSGAKHEVGANSSVAFTEMVEIAKTPYGQNVTSSSSIDRTTEVSVAFTNLRTGELSQPTLCTAGAKLKTHIWFDGNYVWCQAPRSYGAAEKAGGGSQ